MAEIYELVPQRGDVWVSRTNPNIKVTIVGRSKDGSQTVVEPVGDSTFIEGRKAYPTVAFVRAFRLLIHLTGGEE